MEKRVISILGSTGSIGVNTLNVVRQFSERFHVAAIAAGENIDLLSEQVREFRPALVSTRTQDGALKLQKELGGLKPKILYGAEGAEAVAAYPETQCVVSALVGAAGLQPTLAAAKAGKCIALANKEALVVAGALVSRTAKENGATLLPVDSEHSAIFQCLAGAKKEFVKRLLLTASGGPFFLKPEVDLSKVSPEQALNHPNWKMGPKITIDSATLMNKGLEIIEARWLFGFGADQIDVVIHPQSIIHSMVEYVDGSTLAQMGLPDMRGPIAYALTYPERLAEVIPTLDLSKIRELTFYAPDPVRFPSIELALKALRKGETYPAVLNGANEVTVRAFLDHQIVFTDISRINGAVLDSYRKQQSSTLEDFIAADHWGRQQAETLITEQKSK